MATEDNLANLEDMVIRLDWLCMSLSGSEEEEGLIPQINRLFMEGDSPSGSGLLPRLESVYDHGNQLLTHLAQVSDLLDEPIGDEQRKSIHQAINSAIRQETDQLGDELKDVVKAADLASSRITESASKSEILMRSTRDDLQDAERRLQEAVPELASQMRAMVNEMGSILTTDKLREPLEKTLREVMADLSVDHQKERLQAAWKEELDKFGQNIKTDMAQHRETIETMLVESQQEQMARVKKIVDTRTPSETIVSLFDELDQTKGKLAQYEDGVKPPASSASGASGSAKGGFWLATGAAVGGMALGAAALWAYLNFLP